MAAGISGQRQTDEVEAFVGHRKWVHESQNMHRLDVGSIADGHGRDRSHAAVDDDDA